MTIASQHIAVQPRGSAIDSVRRIDGFGTWIALIVIVVVGTVLVAVRTDSTLISRSNLDLIFVTAVPLGLVGIAQTFVILVGHFDLSVAGVISLTVVLTATVMDGQSSQVFPAIALAIGAGIVVGVLNGVIVTKLHVNALIATLGTSLAIEGMLNTLVSSRSGGVTDGFRELGYGEILTVPTGIYLLVAAFVLSAYMLSRTTLGHQMYAVGGNADSARASGIHADRVVIIAFTLSGLITALAGVYLASRLGAGDPGVGDRGGYALNSVAIVVLGGTVLGGGRGGVFGTIGGLLIFAFLDSIFNLLQIDTFLKSMIQGAIIIIAVASYSFRSRRSTG